jgi:hypothetical protein
VHLRSLAVLRTGSYVEEMTKPLLCLLRRHRWHNNFNDEGQRYQTCERCGAYRDQIHLADRPGS